MIVLATGSATFRREGDLTFVSVPSGDGEPVTIALTRHQLGKLAHASRAAVLDAFDAPQPDLASIEPMRRGKSAG